MRVKPLYLFIIILILLAACMVLFICVGKYPVTPLDSLRVLLGFSEGIPQMTVNVILGLRVPRVLTSVLVGAALAASGTVYQGIFKNPLVSPDYLGVTSGACIGAAIAILLGLGTLYISIFAFVSAVAAMLMAMAIPVMLRNNANIMLVLSGIIVGAAMSSILGFIKYLADPNSELASIIYWTMGSFGYVTIGEFLAVLPIIVIPLIVLFLMSYWIDVLSMGESDAKALGANVALIRFTALGCATLMTAAAVSIVGTIGWVGLIIPHIGRLIIGPVNRNLLPCCALLGGLFMLLVDTLTRTISVSEMPVSILTGALGVPFFCWLLYKQRKTLLG